MKEQFIFFRGVFSAIAGFLAIVSLTIAVLPNSDYALKMAFVIAVVGLVIFGSSSVICSYALYVLNVSNATKINIFLARKLYRICFKKDNVLHSCLLSFGYLCFLFLFLMSHVFAWSVFGGEEYHDHNIALLILWVCFITMSLSLVFVSLVLIPSIIIYKINKRKRELYGFTGP
ncbi:hypothetical protein AB4X16_07840 [Edwardsiella tarda]|uniref:hypothetical protein n=1 Tax=Edwardsiella tarda TaxID=636 RepID=UPI0034DCD6D1